MMRYTITLIIFFIISSFSSIHAAKTPSSYTNFIKTKCKNTTYPPLCLQTLIPFASTIKQNPLKLSLAALNVSLQGAKTASAAVTKIAKQRSISSNQKAALKDCIGQIKDAVYEIKLSIKAIKNLGNADGKFQWADAKTQASAAITYAETCEDGINEIKTDPAVKKQIKSYVAYVQKRISNALYLINHLYI